MYRFDWSSVQPPGHRAIKASCPSPPSPQVPLRRLVLQRRLPRSAHAQKHARAMQKLLLSTSKRCSAGLAPARHHGKQLLRLRKPGNCSARAPAGPEIWGSCASSALFLPYMS